jgi:hypothetical protein
MPSIDLVRLRIEARDLADSLQEPEVFHSRLRAMMETYAHRRLRRGRSMAYRGGLPAWEVSGILLRELDSALRPIAQSDSESAVRCADAIWRDGRLEERILAARLLGYSGRQDAIRARLPVWLETTEDPSLLSELADRTCRILRQGPAEMHRADIRTWVESLRVTARWFGWLALGAWLQEGTDDARMTAIDLLAIALPERNADILRTVAGILNQLSASVTAEIRKWLDDLPFSSFLTGQPLFDTALPKMSEDVAMEVRQRWDRPGP